MHRPIYLTNASSVGQGLTECNRCGECCANPCLLGGPGDVTKLAKHLGITRTELVRDKLVIEKRSDGIYVSPKRSDAGACLFFVDSKCSVHPAKPAGGRDYECWMPERTAPARHQRFRWNERQLNKMIENVK